MFLTMDYNYFLQLNKNYFRANAQDKQPEQSESPWRHLAPHSPYV